MSGIEDLVNMTYYQVQGEDVISFFPAHSLTWIFAVTLITAFISAFGIGANDVANSFATAIASKTLTLAKACIIAGLMEFLGAVLMGSNTTSAIRKNIIDVELFDTRQDLLMTAMFCASVGSAIWLLVATRFGMPVSTTHTTIGAILGVGVAAYGMNTINWGWSGVGQIFASFFISPAISGICAAIIFLITKYAILERENSTKLAIYSMPIYGAATMALVATFWVYKGSPSLDLKHKPLWIRLTIILGSTAVLFLVTLFVVVPLMKRITKKVDAKEAAKAAKNNKMVKANMGDQTVDSDKKDSDMADNTNFSSLDLEATAGNGDDDFEEKELSGFAKWKALDEERAIEFNSLKSKSEKLQWFFTTKSGFMYAMDHSILSGLRHDVAHDEDGDDSQEQPLHHALAKRYKPSTETTFMWLQLMSSSFMAFSHGANDVSNSIAPLATVYSIWSHGVEAATAPTDVDVPTWILVFGAVAINLGLFMMGWRIIYALGNNVTYHSPSRGFSMEMGAVVTVLMATFFKIPVSTTHCVCGATVAVGLCEANWRSINWKQVGTNLFGWMLTLPIAGIMSGLLYAAIINGPNVNYTGIYIPTTVEPVSIN